MKNVLIIAYHYPPLGGGGVFRTLKFTKYLPQFGFQPYVLTVKNAMYPLRDPTLLKDVPQEVRIVKTFSLEHNLFLMPFYALRTTPKWIFTPDINIGWLPFAVRRGEELIDKEGVDLIYATAPAYSSLLIGYLLKKTTGKPLVIDFRDPWTQNVFIKYPTMLHKKIEEKMEKAVLKFADYIITTSEPIRLKLIEKYPFMEGKCATITNGFDPDDFKGLKTRKLPKSFRIVHTGSLYGLQTGKQFLLAIKKLIDEKPALRKKLEVIFIGSHDKETLLLVQKLGLEDVVRLISYVSHRECLELMLSSHLLLLLITAKGSHGEGILTGKLFEYLASRRPILAIAPENGVAASMVKSLKAGVVVPADNIELMKKTILNSYEMWKQGKLVETTGDVSIYDRRLLTHCLANIFEKVTA